MPDLIEEHMPELVRLKELTDQLVSPELALQLIDTAPDAWVVVNERGKIILFNQQAEFMFGYARVEVIGQVIEILIPEAQRSVHVQHRTQYVAAPQVRPMGQDLDLEARHKAGHSFSVLINLSPRMTTDGMYVSATIRRKGA
jgi:protein-histidine pros-kinase